MGAHTLGKADILNSGFHGMWVNNEQVLRDLHNKKKSVKFHTWGGVKYFFSLTKTYVSLKKNV